MASYTEVTSKHATLAASTVDDVTITGATSLLQVVNRGSDDIYLTHGASAPTNPTVAGDDTFFLGPEGTFFIPLESSGNYTVKLISTGTPAYSVQDVS